MGPGHRPLQDRRRQDRDRGYRPGHRRRGVARGRRGRHCALARADLRRALAHRLPAHEGAVLGARHVHAHRDGRVRRHLPPVQGRARAVGPLRQPRDAPERLALRRHGRIARLDARSLRGDEDAVGLLRRQAGHRLLDEAARRSGAAGHRPPRDGLRGCRRRGADGGACVRRPAPRRPRDRAQPADVAAGPVPRAHRRRRDSRRGGDGLAGSDAARRDPPGRRGGAGAGVHVAAARPQRQGLPDHAASPAAGLPARVHDADRRRHPATPTVRSG